MDAEERQDWKAYRERGDREAHQRLCERYLKQVKLIVGRMAIYLGDAAMDRDDLVQAGVVGMINAIERFDPCKQVEFLEFAQRRIRGAVYDELRVLHGFSSRSRRQKKHMDQVREHLRDKLLRSPTEEETAAELGITVAQFRLLQIQVRFVRMEPLTTNADEPVAEEIRDGRLQQWMPTADGFSMAEKQRIVAGKIEQLPERTKLVLGLYYRDGLTLKEIAQVLSLTESRICQIHAAAMEQLQQELAGLENAFAHP